MCIDLVARLGEADPAGSRVTPAALAALVGMVGARTLTQTAAREVLDVLVDEGGDPAAVVAARGLGALEDGDALAEIVARAIAADPDGNDVGLMSLVEESRRTWPPQPSPTQP